LSKVHATGRDKPASAEVRRHAIDAFKNATAISAHGVTLKNLSKAIDCEDDFDCMTAALLRGPSALPRVHRLRPCDA
jgi:hypothetical protein